MRERPRKDLGTAMGDAQLDVRMKKYGMTGDSQRKREGKALSIVRARVRHNDQSGAMLFPGVSRMFLAQARLCLHMAFQRAY